MPMLRSARCLCKSANSVKFKSEGMVQQGPRLHAYSSTRPIEDKTYRRKRLYQQLLVKELLQKLSSNEFVLRGSYGMTSIVCLRSASAITAALETCDAQEPGTK
jgi:hypothetical protein